MTDEKERGLTTGKASTESSTSSEFRRSLAVVIGIDQYINGIPPLSTAVNDAVGLAEILKGKEHGYEVILFTDEEANLSDLKDFLRKKLPNT
ncbi:MAG: hypothetical protein D3925_10590, partial [Candidatus Electrothrix sp. AR5]|nr:hypothetical protein [Candidatus Electrothrix sp. AR5]